MLFSFFQDKADAKTIFSKELISYVRLEKKKQQNNSKQAKQAKIRLFVRANYQNKNGLAGNSDLALLGYRGS